MVAGGKLVFLKLVGREFLRTAAEGETLGEALRASRSLTGLSLECGDLFEVIPPGSGLPIVRALVGHPTLQSLSLRKAYGR